MRNVSLFWLLGGVYIIYKYYLLGENTPLNVLAILLSTRFAPVLVRTLALFVGDGRWLVMGWDGLVDRLVMMSRIVSR